VTAKNSAAFCLVVPMGAQQQSEEGGTWFLRGKGKRDAYV